MGSTELFLQQATGFPQVSCVLTNAAEKRCSEIVDTQTPLWGFGGAGGSGLRQLLPRSSKMCNSLNEDTQTRKYYINSDLKQFPQTGCLRKTTLKLIVIRLFEMHQLRFELSLQIAGHACLYAYKLCWLLRLVSDSRWKLGTPRLN
eukprot:1575580-Amphidinium_carterae.1